jgi:hypothetical protein
LLYKTMALLMNNARNKPISCLERCIRHQKTAAKDILANKLVLCSIAGSANSLFYGIDFG